MRWQAMRTWLYAWFAQLDASRLDGSDVDVGGEGTAPTETPIEETGQGLVEYAMILVLVVIVAFIVLALAAPWVGNVFSNVINNI